MRQSKEGSSWIGFPRADGTARRFLWNVVVLALYPLCACRVLSDDSIIIGVPSPNNSIIYEATYHELSSQSGMSTTIQSDVPLTIHRYSAQNELWGQHLDDKNDKRVILISSNCDTSRTNVVPFVEVGRAELGTFVTIELGIPSEEAYDMQFLQSSSYNTVWHESRCGGLLNRHLTSESERGSTAAVCLSEKECDDKRQQMGIGRFQVIPNHSTKGCYTKNGIAYWGSGGAVQDYAKAELPGIQERIWCGVEVDLPTSASEDVASTTTGEALVASVCLSEGECDDKRQQMGIERFQVISNHSTKGCFTKSDGIAYWGSGGTVESISKIDLPGVQERIWCGVETGLTVPLDDGSDTTAPLNGGAESTTTNNESTTSVATEEGFEPTACLTESECDDIRQQMGIEDFRVIAGHSTKGCFSKNNIAYWGSDGSIEAISNTDLPGVQERIWCLKEVDLTDATDEPNDPSDTSDSSTGIHVCLTEETCDEMRLDMGIPYFLVGDYKTKGCFFKNDVAYFGEGGSVEEMKKTNLTGILERIWCGDDSTVTPPVDEDSEQTVEDTSTAAEEMVQSGEYIACLSKEECDEKRIELGIDKFYSSTFPTKGCFFKNGWAYWGKGGTVDENSKAKLPGVQERIWCNDSNNPNLALDGVKATTAPRNPDAQDTMNSGFSVKSFAVSSLLHSLLMHTSAMPSTQLRAVDTCTYHAEILIGCEDCHVKVSAPKARVINSVTEHLQSKEYSYADDKRHTRKDKATVCNTGLKHTAKLNFPDDKAEAINILD